VAGAHLRHPRLRTRWSPPRPQRPTRRHLRYHLPRRQPHDVRSLWKPVAGLQPCGYGVHLVGCPGVAGRRMCLRSHPRAVAELCQLEEHHACELGDDHW
jgi:hypothetical protein